MSKFKWSAKNTIGGWTVHWRRTKLCMVSHFIPQKRYDPHGREFFSNTHAKLYLGGTLQPFVSHHTRSQTGNYKGQAKSREYWINSKGYPQYLKIQDQKSHAAIIQLKMTGIGGLRLAGPLFQALIYSSPIHRRSYTSGTSRAYHQQGASRFPYSV